MRPVIRVIVGCTEPEALRVRPAAIAAYDDARRRRWPFLSDILERALRSPGISSDDGAALRSTVHALVKYHRLLAFASQNDDAGQHFDELFALCRGEDREIDSRIERIDRPTERLGVAWSFPDWMVERIGEELGAEAVERALARMNELAPRVARANSLRSTRDDVLRALAEEGLSAQPTTHAAHGIAFGGHGSVFRTRAFARGDFELQDEASQLVAELVAPPPGSLVIDACAGAGGKTLAIAALLAGKGRVVALDASEDKLAELRRRARRAGAHNVRAVAVDLMDPARLGEIVRATGGPASRVLLDAPCSGFGAIRRNPEARWRLRPADLDRMVETQRALMSAAASLVGVRGRLVYATCSFLPSEGERIVERFLGDRSEFSPVTVRDVLGRARTTSLATPDGRFLRTWRFDGHPEGADANMDGFFAAVVRRAAARGLDSVGS
jgi:16S rRNA (cytosine967-C5)-methyltransferase